MQNLVEYVDGLDASFRKLKLILIVMGSLFGVVAIAAMALSYDFADKSRRNIYVLDQGHSLLALQAEAAPAIDLEVADHVRTFHLLFFNLAPNREAINANMEAALKLGDHSVADYWNDLQEDNHFNRIMSANITQQIKVDSVKVDVSGYPYRVHTYAKIFTIRESLMTRQLFESTCNVYKTAARSSSNPHGLLIEKFLVTKFEVENSVRR